MSLKTRMPLLLVEPKTARRMLLALTLGDSLTQTKDEVITTTGRLGKQEMEEPIPQPIFVIY